MPSPLMRGGNTRYYYFVVLANCPKVVLNKVLKKENHKIRKEYLNVKIAPPPPRHKKILAIICDTEIRLKSCKMWSRNCSSYYTSRKQSCVL